MFEIKTQAFFAAAHHLLNYEGECENQHGHNWMVEAFVTGSTLDKGNIFIFISSSGKFESTLNLAKEAKLHGMIVISISSIENNDLAEISNYNIRFFF